jgi:cyclopropane-fatty-acyl-phospholipid synthase
MTEVGNSLLAGAAKRALMSSRDWDPRVRILARLLEGLRYGSLSVTLPSGQKFVRVGAERGPEASVVIHRWRALWRLFAGGDIGFAQAWIDGDWSSLDLTALIRLAARNLHALGGAPKGSSFSRVAFRLRHLLNANTRRGSARNVVAHYDLGNDFFRVWLDGAMFYSSALWDGSTATLEAAQSRKIERVRDLLEIKGGERILEIGCGWGALAVRLAESGAAHVAGLTLSPAQLDFARSLVAARGLASRVDFRLQDYRDIDGLYDRIVSIEMVEAVGEAWWPTYFGKIARSMKPGGRAVLQAITIAEEHFDDYRRAVDFIQRHIFPGGCLPSKTVLHQQFERAGLRLVSHESFGLSYARTLAEWRRRFHTCWPEIAALGFDDRFRRLWDYYLSYCAAGFLEGVTDVGLYCVEHANAAGRAKSPQNHLAGGARES